MPQHVLFAVVLVLVLGLWGMPALGQQPGQPPGQQPGRPAATAASVVRVAGVDRITTAVEVTEQHWKTASTVLVARSDDYPDALAAGALAAARQAPILLTHADRLTAELSAELTRLRATNVILLGGTQAISPAVEQQIRALSTRPLVSRIYGADRIATAAELAKAAPSPAGEAVLTLADSFADALAAGALVASPARTPVLLTQRDVVPDVTMQTL